MSLLLSKQVKRTSRLLFHQIMIFQQCVISPIASNSTYRKVTTISDNVQKVKKSYQM